MKLLPKYRVVASALLLLFLTFQGGRMMCFHTHVLGNTVISHSHPFNNPDRPHTTAELEAFAIIGSSVLTDNSAITPEMPVAPVVSIEEPVIAGSSSCIGFCCPLNGRDPPATRV